MARVSCFDFETTSTLGIGAKPGLASTVVADADTLATVATGNVAVGETTFVVCVVSAVIGEVDRSEDGKLSTHSDARLDLPRTGEFLAELLRLPKGLFARLFARLFTRLFNAEFNAEVSRDAAIDPALITITASTLACVSKRCCSNRAVSCSWYVSTVAACNACKRSCSSVHSSELACFA